MTNFDRIKSMCPEEMIKFLQAFEEKDIDYSMTYCDMCCIPDCADCLKWWLKNDSKAPQGLDFWKGWNYD